MMVSERFHLRIKGKKGDSASNIIAWIGLLLAVLICVSFVAAQVKPGQLIVEVIHQDLTKVQTNINNACNSYYYRAKFNPMIEQGILTVMDNQVCINSTYFECKEFICEDDFNISLDLSNITYLVIEKNETVQLYPE
ncbi:hypothetical protein KY338_04690 [Candidatus Woesearchaeota archaeon]|nr:hypothetical protein [Candidatus Woesearchaeota archaeon]MBW3006203.1 hypothetical protein [Candidatus Woesearchaeota archaeon]